MYMSPPWRRFRRKLNLEKYLGELAVLIGRPVHADELGDLEQVLELQEAAKKFVEQPLRTCEILFSERCSEQFNEFVERLHNANPSPVQIWTPRTIDCGIFIVPSIAAIRFDFEFTVNEDGLLIFSTTDSRDRLLLDFSEAPTGEQVMKIETQGIHWLAVPYNQPSSLE